MRNLGVATVVVAPLAMRLGGRLALAWALGWSWIAILVWTLTRLPQGVWLIGLSAGGAVGVGSFGLGPSSFQSILLAVIIWGALGGFAWRYAVSGRTADARTLGKIGADGLLVGFFGSLLAALIGNVLLRVDLKVAGFLIGFVFMGPCWTVGMIGGVMLGTFGNRHN